nr:TorF family putative porin [Sphingobium nicotianae]
MFVALALAAPAPAQLSFGASVASDSRLRGHSRSQGRPAASASIGYDDASGLFASGSGTVFLAPGNEGVRWMGGVVALGYAQRLRDGLSVELGALRAQYSRASYGRPAGYSELFAGLSGRVLSARIAFSPDYLRPGVAMLYGQVEAVTRPATDWRLFGHVGALTRLGGMPAFPISATQYDWRAGIGRVAGKFDLELSLSSGGPDRDYYGQQMHTKTALVGAVSVAF